jgi:hypothetical protein
MPKAASLQSSFNAGELSPLMYGRVDSPRYKEGLQNCLNYIPTLQGPLSRRPGTKFCAYTKSSTQAPVLIPFIFSETQAYMLEFGQNYIRFFANNGEVVTSGTTYKVSGIKNWAYTFYGSRASNNLGPFDETILTTSTITTGSILEVQSPYAYTDLPALRFAQNADTLYLFHPNYPPYKLQRFGQNYWDLTQVFFTDGPYLPLNSYSTVGDNVNVTLAVTSVTTNAANIVTGPTLAISGAVTDPAGSGQILITTSTAHGYTNGQLVWITGIGGTTEALNYDSSSGLTSEPASWPILVISPTTFLLVGSTFVHTYTSGGSVYPALFSADVQQIINTSPFFNPVITDNFQRNISLLISGQRYFGVLSAGPNPNGQFVNAATARIYFTGIGNSKFTTTGVATAWQLGVYCYGQGFPSCGTFHQDRLVIAGSTNNPQEVDGSVTSKYESFAASDPTTLSVADNNALSFQLNSTSINQIQWLSSTAQGLLAGTYVSEWSMQPSANSETLSPTNFNAQQTSYYGSANAEVVQAGNATLYIQRAMRKVREMTYFFQVGTFRSTDLTELSEHITIPAIAKIVHTKETQPLVWGIRSDGYLLSLIYDRTDVQLDAGWTRHELGGQSDSSNTNPIIISAGVIPSVDVSFDQLWLVVQRYINGAMVNCIEYMTKIFNDSILQEDAFQLDCGGTYDNPLTITGITNASPAVVTSAAHGLSNGNSVRIVGVDGLYITTTDVNGNQTQTNLVNETTFVVAGVTTNTFQLHDFSGNAINSTGYSAYTSGGQVRKLVTTISNLTWLEGETVGILADGSWHPDVVVSSGGSITLQYPAAKVQIGYRFPSQGQLLRAEAGAADGTSIGKTRRTTRAAFMLHSCGDLSIGTSFNNLIPISFTQSDTQQADEATPLYTGIKRDGVESAYDFESQLCFQQNSPLPGDILAVTSFMEEFDV